MVCLDYLETHIINICNLKCKGCSHFSPFVQLEDKDVSIENFERDLRIFAKKIDYIYQFRMLGGEPFLCGNITDYIRIARDILPDTDIRVVTNGTLIKNTDEKVFETFAQHNIGIDISHYPVFDKYIEIVIEILQKYKIDCRISERIELFHKRLNLNGDSDINEVFRDCPAKKCAFFLDGQLANCSAPLLAKFINKRFGTDIKTDSSTFDLLQPEYTGEDIIEYLSKPMPACSYCSKPQEFKWESVKTVKLEDWLIGEECDER